MILDHLGSYDHLMNSSSIPVRLNMALNLGRVHTDEAYRALLELADDPQINVAYSAVVGLGRQGRGGAVPELLERIEASDHWYYQLNAYQALRRLGWHQKWRPHQ
jgi:HEAT repeat protein